MAVSNETIKYFSPKWTFQCKADILTVNLNLRTAYGIITRTFVFVK